MTKPRPRRRCASRSQQRSGLGTPPRNKAVSVGSRGKEFALDSTQLSTTITTKSTRFRKKPPEETARPSMRFPASIRCFKKSVEVYRLRRGGVEENYIPYVVSARLKSTLLKKSPHSASKDSEAILNNIKELDNELGGQFHVKNDLHDRTPFKVLIEVNHYQSDPAELELPGFIAISYCWQNPSWKPVSGFEAYNDHGESLPIAKSIFQVALEQRVTSAEGVVEALWIDNSCINQKDRHQKDRQEKMYAIASMDRIFHNARLVVIALEDVKISRDEAKVIGLLKGLKQPPNRGIDHEDSFKSTIENNVETVWSLVTKIGSARWFERAWCTQEFHVCKDAIFVIPRGEGTTVTLELGVLEKILRCQTYWTPRLRAVTKTSSESYSRLVLLFGSRFVISKRILPSSPVIGVGYQVGKLNATNLSDKVSIALNLLGLGLYFDGDVKSHDHYRYILSTLAIAVGDSLALCCSGPKLRGDSIKKSENYSYIQWPQLSDLVHLSNRYPPVFQGWGKTINFRPNRLTIDAYFLAVAVREPSDECRRNAKEFLEACWEEHPDILQRIQPEQWTTLHLDEKIFVEYGTTYLACALDLGYNWIKTSLERLSNETVPRGLRDDTEGLFNPLGKLIEKHLFASFKQISHDRDHEESRKLLLSYIEFAFHHIPLIAVAGRDTAIIQSNDTSESAMITVPEGYCSSSTTLCLPITLAEPVHLFTKRLWLLKAVNGAEGVAYGILDKAYLWGLGNPAQCTASSMWQRTCIHIVDNADNKNRRAQCYIILKALRGLLIAVIYVYVGLRVIYKIAN